MTIDVSPGKQVTITSELWLQIFANQGSLGVQLSDKQAMELASGIIASVRKRRKSN
jgi:hypothetical protein